MATVAAEGCSPLQELEKAGRRAAFFLVLINSDATPHCPIRQCFAMPFGSKGVYIVIAIIVNIYLKENNLI